MKGAGVKKIVVCLLMLCSVSLASAQTVQKCGDTAVSLREYFERGIACFNEGLYPAAVDDFTHALASQPNDVAVLAWRAHVYGEGLAAYDLALADYSLILQLDPQNAAAYYHRGYSHQQLGERDQALADYNRALQLDSAFAAAYADRGLLYLELGEEDSALADMSQAIALNYEPLDWLYQKRGEFYANHGQYTRALDDFSAAIALMPDSGFYYNWRGYAYRQLGDNQAALDDFTRAVELNPQDSFAYTERGRLWFQLGDYPQAMRDLDYALQLDPHSRDAYLYRGNIFRDTQQFERALNDYRRAADIDPNYPALYAGMGDAYYGLGENGLALENYHRYLAMVGDPAGGSVLQRVSELERPPVWTGALYLVLIVAVVLGFRLLRRYRSALIQRLSARPAPQPDPDWLHTLSSDLDSGD